MGNFPVNSQGVIFALVELSGSLFSFVQFPITEAVKGNKDIETYIYFEIGLTCAMLLTLPFMFFIAFDKSPKCIAYLDRPRSTAMRPSDNKTDEIKDESVTLKTITE